MQRRLDATVGKIDCLEVKGTSRGKEDVRKLGLKHLEMTLRYLIY